MIGAGKVSAIRVDDIGCVLSGVGSRLTITTAAGQPLPKSYCTPLRRHISRAAAFFTIGIRGATPPPAGWRRDSSISYRCRSPNKLSRWPKSHDDIIELVLLRPVSGALVVAPPGRATEFVPP